MAQAKRAGEIAFNAAVYKVQTLVDSGIRISFDLSENEIVAMAQLAECQRDGVVLAVTCVPKT